MSDTIESLRRKMSSAGDLQSVVRTMKALAASNIGQYERSVRALADYYRTVELGLSAWFRENRMAPSMTERNVPNQADAVGAVVFGSDQGLVGRFNDVVADHAIKTLDALSGKAQVWAVGERVHARLADAGLSPIGLLAGPNSVQGITSFVAQILIESEVRQVNGAHTSLFVVHNRPLSGALYEPVSQRLLPLDAQWQHDLARVRWPTGNLPEIVSGGTRTASALVHEYLFISLFRACAESLASENASRLAAMERADKSISELLAQLHGTFQQLRQTGIDEELFDVISGFEALVRPGQPQRRMDGEEGQIQGLSDGGRRRERAPEPEKRHSV
ncbi:F0F1 ATP synthase subunit gamma [Rhizorhapis sp. SPR117]|uniref:F0F1 ATP synthase subunit gamma n=1 Tax=Rhizorhapis sp. SPR117 TaxID=2912611 RepID=UPI001F024C4F|nr:F0F1 ATP synthase subunit gamma [Rhizorhapis sp. SPR117]